MYQFLKLTVLLAIVTSLTTGCVNLATSSVSPLTDLTALKTMYVKHYPSDNSGVDLEIADKLRSKGVKVKTGAETTSSDFDAIVTYVDKWKWDMSMYLLELTINIRDPKTESTLATGKSYHTSLTRKSQTQMVDEVVNNIYDNPSNVLSKNTSIAPIQQPTQINPTIKPVALSTPVGKSSEASNSTNLSQKLQELSNLRKEGIITEDEYISKRRQVIEKF